MRHCDFAVFVAPANSTYHAEHPALACFLFLHVRKGRMPIRGTSKLQQPTPIHGGATDGN